MEILTEHKSEGLLIRMFVLPIYESKVCFVRYDNSEAYSEALKFCEGLGLKTADYNTDEYLFAYGFVIKDKTDKGFVHFIFLNGCSEYRTDLSNTIAHENYHLVTNICRYHGLVAEVDGDNEHIAYLIGYMYDIIEKLFCE